LGLCQGISNFHIWSLQPFAPVRWGPVTRLLGRASIVLCSSLGLLPKPAPPGFRL
jgi:hypothetical protein